MRRRIETLQIERQILQSLGCITVVKLENGSLMPRFSSRLTLGLDAHSRPLNNSIVGVGRSDTLPGDKAFDGAIATDQGVYRTSHRHTRRSRSPSRPGASFKERRLLAIFHPWPIGPNAIEQGTTTLSKKTSLKKASPVICFRGRIVMPGVCISRKKIDSPWCLGTSGSVRANKNPH